MRTKRNQRVIVIGGDGFCGWPTALHLLNSGYEVLILDNLSRRDIDIKLGSRSLTNISSIETRVATARKLIGPLTFLKCDTRTQVSRLRDIIRDFLPQHIIMFGEQRSAPYSMIDDKSRRYTIDNNISSTHNICSAVVDIDKSIHLVHLGTMGVYGYNDKFGTIPEGYLDITVNSTQAQAEILYPADPGSIYHLTKCLDQIIFQYYNSNWGLRITDLHQGIVWGINTEETSYHKNLINRFDYDGIYGTVLNRFIVQSIMNQPLTIYGTGGQKRAFINIKDTVACIKIAIESYKNMSDKKVRILNQISEIFTVRELAKLVSHKTGTNITQVDNPRNELHENDLSVLNKQFLELGFDPIYLNDYLIEDILSLAKLNNDNWKFNCNLTSPKWN